ncbi:MAG: hypothetical protein V1765_01420 [bacterium]
MEVAVMVDESKVNKVRQPIVVGDLTLAAFDLDYLMEDSTRKIIAEDWWEHSALFKTIEIQVGLKPNGHDFDRIYYLLTEPIFHKLAKSLTQVVRWNRFVEQAGHGDMFRQHNVLQHSYSSAYIAKQVATDLQWSKEDIKLETMACESHDWPEGLRLLDIAYPDKVDEDDITECWAMDHYLYNHCLSLKQANKIMRAYMVQYAVDGKAKLVKDFPERAQEQLATLQDKQEVAWLFYFLERFGYFIYAVEQYLDYDYPYMLGDVLHNCWADMKAVMERVPGLDRVLMRPHKVKHLDEIYFHLLA